MIRYPTRFVGAVSILSTVLSPTVLCYSFPRRIFFNTSSKILLMMSSSSTSASIPRPPGGDDHEGRVRKARIAQDIMKRFAYRTGLLGDEINPKERRYLWTDSFAVGNFLQLARESEEAAGTDQASVETCSGTDYRQLALKLVTTVHDSLGRFRDDDCHGRANKYLSGSAEHPVAGGLRIGKSMNEKEPGDPYDRDAEWDRDGQYFHYLTKWMTALDQLTRYTQDPKYNKWALEAMSTAADKFVYQDAMFGTRMYWKMSIDLSRPQVHSQGASDPIDGYVTLSRLIATCNESIDSKFEKQQKTFLSMVQISSTEDSLG